MQAQTSHRQPPGIYAWLIGALGVVVMLLLLLSFFSDSRQDLTTQVAGSTTNRVAYLQFGLEADSLRLVDPGNPAATETLFTIPHATEYGLLPSISPDGQQFAYTVLPTSIASPRPSSPAELWVSTIGAAEPRLVAEPVDLLVPPVWTPDGASLVYRLSATGVHTLAMRPITGGGDETTIAHSETESLFPVGFTPDGARMLYVGLSNESGTHLYGVDLASGESSTVAKLSPGLTREWSLSPDGRRLVFLEIALSDTEVASRATALNLEDGALTALTAVDEAAFGPIWSTSGAVIVGVFHQTTGDASLLLIDGDSHTRIEGPQRGFDVPLAYDTQANAYVVSTFENDSITSPGRSVLTLVKATGERTLIAEGEVTLVGWTHP